MAVTFAEDFSRIVDLCAELEDVGIPTRVKQRLCHAYDRAICKALAINFSYEVPDMDYVQHTLLRHAERGARDFVP